MVCTPGFGTVGRNGEPFGQSVEALEHYFHRNLALIFRKNFLTEVFFDVLANHEHNFAESGADCIKYRVVHDGLALGAYAVKLFQTAVAAAHTGCKYK